MFSITIYFYFVVRFSRSPRAHIRVLMGRHARRLPTAYFPRRHPLRPFIFVLRHLRRHPIVHTLRAVYLSSLIPGLDLNLAELSASPVASYGNAVPYSTRGELQYLLATRRSAGNLVGFEPVQGARVYTRA